MRLDVYLLEIHKSNMPTKIQSHHIPWMLALVLALICSACASSGTISKSSTASSATHLATRQPTTTGLFLSGPITYVAIGASDAVGVGSNQPASQGYVPRLAARLPKGSHLINLGVSGIRLHEALSQELPIALRTAPNLVTIWLVANDFVDGVTYNDYIHDLNILLEQLHANTHARLVMANLPDLAQLPAFARLTATQKAHMRQEIQQWNAGIAALATRYAVILVNLFSRESQLTAHPEYVSADGFHPSSSGYAQLAKLFWLAINES